MLGIKFVLPRASPQLTEKPRGSMTPQMPDNVQARRQRPLCLAPLFVSLSFPLSGTPVRRVSRVQNADEGSFRVQLRPKLGASIADLWGGNQ